MTWKRGESVSIRSSKLRWLVKRPCTSTSAGDRSDPASRTRVRTPRAVTSRRTPAGAGASGPASRSGFLTIGRAAYQGLRPGGAM